MSNDDSKIDDILKRLKDELEESESTADIKNYTIKQKKFDTQALLDEILGNVELHREAPPPPAEKPAEEPHIHFRPNVRPKQTPAEDAPSKQEPERRQVFRPTIKMAERPAPEPEPEPDQPLLDVDEQSLEEEKKREREQIRQIMQNSTHLKYMTLLKNREKKIRDFTLKPLFAVTQPIEVHKEDLKEELKEKPEEKAPEIETEQTTVVPESPEPTPEGQPQEDNSPIREYVPGETPTGDVPSGEDDPVPQEYKTISAQHIREWRSRLEEQVREEQDDQPAEYTVPAQTGEALQSIKDLKTILSFKTIILAVLFALSVALGFLNMLPIDNPIPLLDPVKNPMVVCVINLVLLIATFVTCFDVVRDGVVHLVRRSPGRYSAYSVALIFMLIFNAVLLISPEDINNQFVSLYVPLAILIFGLVLFGKTLAIKRMLTNFRFVSGDTDKYAVDIMENMEMAEDFTKGVPVDYPNLIYNKKTPFLSQFFTESFSEDLSDRVSRYITPAVFLIALVTGAAALITGFDIFVAFTAMTGVLLIGAGSITLFMVNYPLLLCSKNLSKLGGAVLGYNAVDNFSEINSVVINASNLFNPSNVILYGIKTFSNMAIDRAILDATSVMCETKSVLSGVFLNIINDRRDYLEAVDTIIYEDGMGISAWMKNRRVLIGSRELMINHNIMVPSRDYENKFIAQDKNLVYLSTEGELSAVFVFGLEADDDVRNMLVDVYNNGLVSIIKTVDPILTAAELSRVFSMPEEAFRVIPSRLHKETAEMSETKGSADGAVCNNGTLAAFIYSFLHAKRLNKPINLGMLINFVSIGVGVLLFVAFTLLKSLNQLTNMALCLYEVISLAICIAAQKMNRLS